VDFPDGRKPWEITPDRKIFAPNTVLLMGPLTATLPPNQRGRNQWPIYYAALPHPECTAVPAVGSMEFLQRCGYLEKLTEREQENVRTYIQNIRIVTGNRTRTNFYLTTYRTIMRVDGLDLSAAAKEHTLVLPNAGYCNWKHIANEWLHVPTIHDVVKSLMK
jgi:hypothetical protein